MKRFSLTLLVEVNNNKEIQKISLNPNYDRWEVLFLGPPLAIFDDWMESYLRGEPNRINLPLNFASVSSFQQKGLKAIKEIPFGTTMSYGSVAANLHSPRAARALGSCCRNNPFPLVIGCHRVVRSNGEFGNFLFGSEMKENLIEFEKTKAVNPI